jgi:hypothetical protein
MLYCCGAYDGVTGKAREDSMPPFPSQEVAHAADNFRSLGGEIENVPSYCYDASLLFRRMGINGIARTEFAQDDPLLFCELQARCTLCPSKEQCVFDLAHEADDACSDGWRGYCPNAATLVALGAEQSRRAADVETAALIQGAAATAYHKIFLERRSGESRFGPRSYYYPASKGGVVPG